MKRCAAAGAAVESAPCDVAREEQVNDAVARCLDRFGRLDVLVNVAGILLLSHTHETTLAQWQKVLDVNLTGTFLFCKAALPHLLASRGNIVNTSSTSAHQRHALRRGLRREQGRRCSRSPARSRSSTAARACA